MSHDARTLLRADGSAAESEAAPALPLTGMAEPLVDNAVPVELEAVAVEPARALAVGDRDGSAETSRPVAPPAHPP